jgi:hypothetical protein
VQAARKTKTFIDAFRKLDNLRATKVLVYAVRSNDQAARSNALLILANVINNATVCVAIDHLYDTKIAQTPFGNTGRANLLAVLSSLRALGVSRKFRHCYDRNNCATISGHRFSLASWSRPCVS